MELVKVEGKDFDHALNLAKKQYGNNVQVITYHNGRRGGFLGLFSERYCMVTVAYEREDVFASQSLRKPDRKKFALGSQAGHSDLPAKSHMAIAANAYGRKSGTREATDLRSNTVGNQNSDDISRKQIQDTLDGLQAFLPDNLRQRLERERNQPQEGRTMANHSIGENRLTHRSMASTTDSEKEMEAESSYPFPKRSAASKSKNREMDELREQISNMNTKFSDLYDKIMLANMPSKFGGYLDYFYRHLEKRGILPEIAKDIVNEIALRVPDKSNRFNVLKVAIQMLSKYIRITGPIKTRNHGLTIVALVGPTGVGKTTSLAKLAANYSLFHRKKVGLITGDCYRLAAEEQLQKIAEIINVPLEVVYKPSKLRMAIKRFERKDLILIDTPGQNPRNQFKISGVKDFLNVAQPDEIHLVVSATTKTSDMVDIFNKFSDTKFDRILLSKVDETTNFGSIFNLLYHHKIPISYLSTGQEVPDDLEVCNCERLAKMIIGEVKYE